MTGTRPKTLVIGFDALDFRYLDRFSDSLDAFQRLRERGLEAPLDSTFPPWTGSAWPSVYTGTDPSHHGVYDFFTIDGYPDDADLVTRDDVDRPAIWDYLDEGDGSSIVLNVPVTHPATDVDGVLVPGYLAGETAPGHPEGIREELSEAIGERYRIYSDSEASDRTTEVADFVDLIDLRKRAATYLLAEKEWEFAFLQVQKTDTVFHTFEDETAFRRVYEAADDFLGEVLDTVDENVNVVVCSDHGIGPKQGYGVYVNEILRNNGYVETGSGGTGPQLKHVKRNLKDSTSGDAGDRSRVDATLTWFIERFGPHLPVGTMYAVAERLGVAEGLRDRIPHVSRAVASDGIDWTASTAYCRSGPRLGVRINKRGRDPAGVVPESEYEAVREELIELLESVETPDGRAAFEDVSRREAVYDGEHADRADDILLTPRAMDNGIGTELFGREFVDVDTFDHKRTGVFLAAGPAFETGAAVERLSLPDVAPIVMATLGRPVPDRMTGSVPSGLLSRPATVAAYEDLAVSRPGPGDTDRTREDDSAMEARLEDLGYL